MTELDIEEISVLSKMMFLTRKLYLQNTPMATPQELSRACDAVAGSGHDEEAVFASDVVAMVMSHMEQIGLKIPIGDPILTEAILDVSLSDMENEKHPGDVHRVARRAWVLWMQYSLKKMKKK